LAGSVGLPSQVAAVTKKSPANGGGGGGYQQRDHPFAHIFPEDPCLALI
jgi:hypothetical protein